MQTLLTVAAILGLTALFSYINERFLHLQQTIGLVLLALCATLALMVLNGLGLGAWVWGPGSPTSRPWSLGSRSTTPC